MIIPEWLFDERKTFSVRFPYSPVNKKFSKAFVRKVENFTNDKVKVIIMWNTQKINSLFNNKDKVKHHSCMIYRGICSCGAYVHMYMFWKTKSRMISTFHCKFSK